MERIIEVSIRDEAEAINHCFDRLLDPNQYGGPWFNGDPAEAEDWMGDVFLEAVEYFLEGLGYTYKVKDND